MNVLLLQLKRIGDLILTTPAISAVRAKFPDANISLIVSPGCAELQISHVDQKLVVNELRTWIAVGRGNFDCTVDFTRNDRSAFLTWLSRGQTRIASERHDPKSRFRSRAYNKLVPASVRDLHTVDYHLKLLEPLGVAVQPSPAPELKIPQSALSNAASLCANHKVHRPYVVFHPGSARQEKFWQPDRWAEVIEYAGEHYPFDLVLTAGASALEQNHIAEIKTKLRGPAPKGFASPDHFGVVDLSGQTDLLTLAALVANARLLVTVDSAPMHFAAATRTPQVALFGPTNPFHWRPRNAPALILQGPSAKPLTQFSPDQPSLPMNQISTRGVIDAMDALLASPPAQG
jgi:ADP-heptose:LPS heptosyltransferase